MGGLVQASEEVEEQRTVKFILRRTSCTDIDSRLVRLFVKVIFFYRIKCINLKVKYASRKKYKSLRDAVKVSHQMF